jgi:hypothetical protein
VRGVFLAVLLVCLWTGVVSAAPDFTVTGVSQGQDVSGALRVSATPSGATVQSVTFTLMNAAGATVANTMEWVAPYCFLGDFGVLPCTAFDTTKVPNGAYTMRVVMIHSTGALTLSIGFTITNGVVALPGKPSAPLVTRRDVMSWSMFWFNTAVDATAIEVERGTTLAGPFTLIATLPPDADVYDDKTVTLTGTYCWRLRARKGTSMSIYSNVICTP